MKSTSILKLNLMRATLTLALIVTCATAWAGTVQTYYIDENGTRHDVTATLLTGTGNLTADQWYVVNSDVTISNSSGQIYCYGNINLILADGKTFTISSSNTFGIICSNHGTLNIYGQENGTGTLNVTATGSSNAIFANSGVNIVGCNVTATTNDGNGIFSKGNITISGGQVSATGSSGKDGLKAYGTITLGWRKTTDHVYASSYYADGTIKVEDGLAFTDGTTTYSGTLNTDQISAIAGKTLTPDISGDFAHEGNTYTIRTATGWGYFCDSIDNNPQNYFSGKTVYLANDIEVSRIAGSGEGDNLTASDRPFCGTFDGQENTLTFNYGSSEPANVNNLAPFRYVNDATIQHLHVAGTIYTKQKHTGGIVGQAYGTTNITDCRSSVNIISSINGDGTHGGIMSCSWKNSTTNIEGCIFDGSIQSAENFTTDQCGGFVGWKNATINVSNSLLTADLSTIGVGTGDYPSATFVRNGNANTITNCHYTEALGTPQGTKVYSITAGQYVTVDFVEEPTSTYPTSGIVTYGTAIIKCNDVLYACENDNVSLTLGNTPPEDNYFNDYIVSGGILTGEENPYTLTMSNANVTIGADFCYSPTPTLLALVDNSITAHGATLNWTGNSDSYVVMVGKPDTPTTFQTIDFATGDFSQGDFSSTNNYPYPFEVSSGVARSTNKGKPNTTSNMVLQVTIPAAGTLQFQAVVSSQKNYDKAYFSIDGTNKIDGISGPYTTNTNINYEYTLTAGTHTLRWYYTKDGSGDGNQDRFFVDNIIIKVPVPSSWDEYTANTTSITLNDLDPSTLYMAKVIGKCGSNGQSEPSNAIYFTTGQETFTKDIEAHGEGNGGWYLIASPLDSEVEVDEVEHLQDNVFDLYYFDQSREKEWVNYKDNESHTNVDPGFNLVSGKGYLYANSGDVTLTFTGTPYSGEGEVTLSNTQGAEFAGWNLVGNPFAEDAYIEKPFYTLNEERTGLIAEPTTGVIPAMEGVFVYAEEDGETLTFSTNEPESNGDALTLNVSKGRSVIDRAIVNFGHPSTLRQAQGSGTGQTLPKFQLDPNHTKVYIPQGGKDYAVVNAENQGEIPVNFRAEENGTYTITINSEGVEMSYLHLIDNMTGADVDLLTPPAFGHPLTEGDLPLSKGGRGDSKPASYTFEAKTTDYESRFKLVFACGDANDDNADAPFAFISNGNIIINGTGTLQMFDILGRQVYSHESNSAFSIQHSAFPAGVYVLRLINGDNVRTQKIVVK